MATVIEYETKLLKRFTCYHCTAIVEYKPSEVKVTDRTDEGCRILGLFLS
jgi:hypothetical protein